ncbi:MAG: phage terminase large subunit family protein, partial [Ghiorsea sp.]
VLSSKGSSEAGRWRTSRVPFLQEPMDCLSQFSPVKKVVIKKGTQLAFTEMALNWMGYVVHHAPAPLLIVYPSLEVRDRVIAQRINPLLQETPELEALIHAKASRAKTNAKDMKDFPGGIMVLSGANSPSSLGSMPVRYVICDEVDRFPWQVGSGDKSEGDPISLIEARQANFPRRKILMISSPTIKGHSHIDEAYEGGDKREYTMPCPHCDEGLVFRWKGLHWTAFDGVVKEVWYVCEHCGGEVKEFDKPDMLAKGQWVAQRRAPYRSYHINGLYSPIGLGFTWTEIVDKWLACHKDTIKLKSFINTVLGEAWEDQASELKPAILAQRAEEYPNKTVPKDCLILTCGVDTQDDRLAFLVLGHGRGGVSWVIDWLEIPGKPDRMLEEAAKKQGAVYDYLSQPFRNTYGKDVFISATAIDTGGHHTHDVYAFVRSRCLPRLMAIKGSSIPNKPVLAPRATAQDVNKRGKVIKGGVMLWMVGSDSAKHVLTNRLIGDAGLPAEDRKLRFPSGFDEDFYKQLLAEVFDPEKNRWVKRRGRRNEATDCFSYALAASQHPEVRVQSKRVRDWQGLARLLQPEDVVEDAEVVEGDAEDVVETTGKRRRTSRQRKAAFVKRW